MALETRAVCWRAAGAVEQVQWSRCSLLWRSQLRRDADEGDTDETDTHRYYEARVHEYNAKAGVRHRVAWPVASRIAQPLSHAHVQASRSEAGDSCQLKKARDSCQVACGERLTAVSCK